MVGDDPEDDVGLRPLPVLDGEQGTRAFDDRLKQIGVEIRELPLQHRGRALEAHAGVNRWLGQWMQIAFVIPVELHEDEVPDLDVPRGVRRERIVILAGLEPLRAVVIEDLRARAAGTGVPHLPEVVFLAATRDATASDVSNAGPQALGFVILAEHGHVEALLGKAVDFRHEFPSESDRIRLEVVAEREVAEHFEERVVAARAADVLEVVVLPAGANALLRSGRSGIDSSLLAKEDVLELVHARVSE